MPARKDWRLLAVARIANVSERTARRWRDTNDPRWTKASEKIGTSPATTEPTRIPAAGQLHDGVARLSSLADELAARIKVDDTDTRSGLIRDYTAVLDQLRKLRSENPEISQAEGSMVPFDAADAVIAARDAALIPLLRSLPGRLAVVCANRPAAEIAAEVESEIAQIMRTVEAALV